MNCSICHSTFELESEDIAGFRKFGFEPLPTCPQCMHMNRLCFRNERVFYRRKCDATGESIISLYAPDSPYKVYKADYFWSDKWNPLDFGRDFDFSRPFFEQFAELKLAVPRLAIHNVKAENSEYCNTSYGNKNSYMIFGGDYNQDCMFGILCDKNKSCTDLDFSYRCELLYFCSDAVESYNSRFLFNSKHCSDCNFCDECVGCNECILCFNLKNREYCIENRPYPREEYFKKKKELITGKWSDQKALLEKFLELRKKQITRFAHVINCQDCTGDYMKNSKKCTACFDVSDSEDCRQIIYGAKIKDCFHCSMLGIGSTLCFNSISTFGSYNVHFSFFGIDGSNLAYCDFCTSSHDLFGCVCLNHQNSCILNKKYSEADYKVLRDKIIEHMVKTGEWGKFFPAKLSCFGYNETTANLYFPLTKEIALSRGFNWRDQPEKPTVPQTYEIPDDIKEVGDEILNDILVCDTCGKNHKIIEQEFKWLKSNGVPVPRTCTACRLQKRADMRNPRHLWDRSCTKCGAPLKSTYAPKRPETIYCEKCYLEIVY